MTHPKKIGLVMATIIGMNAMIGAGIFSVPTALGALVGPAGLITFIFVIFAVYFMGQSLARLAELYPQEGSFYVYASQWGGHWMGLFSAGAYLIGLTTAMGLLIQIAATYLHLTFPTISEFALGVITLIALTILSIIGVHLSQIGQIILIALTILPLIVITFICLLYGDSSNFYPFAPYGWNNIFIASRAVIFGFFGFEAAASLFNVVENPKKNVPKALVYAIALVGALYFIFVASIIYAIPLAHLASGKPLPELLQDLVQSKWIIYLIHVCIVFAILGTLHSMVWASSELLLAFLATLKIPTIKKLIKKKVINQRMTVLLISLGIFISFITVKNLDLFFSITATFIVTAFVTSMITLLTLKSEWKSKQNIKTIIGLFTAFIILYFSVEGIIANL